MGVAATVRVDVQFTAGVWTNVTADTVAHEGMRFRRGMSAGGPRDRLATTGTLELVLQNDASCSGGVQGYYSPGHTNCRSGWTFGVPIRVVGTYSSTDYPLWRGRVRTIDPTPGRYGRQRVSVTAQDCMGDLAECQVREVTPQVDKTEVELLQAIVAAMPAALQPPATSYDAALDAYPFALDDFADGGSAMAMMAAVADSAVGYIWASADGTLKYTNRQTWATATPSTILTESLIYRELEVPTSRENVYNRIRVTAHPRAVDAENNTILWSADSIIVVAPGQTVTVWASYTDPGNPERLVGATAIQETPTPYLDWAANVDPTGLSTDATGSVTVSVTGFASTAKIEITNGAAVSVYLVDSAGVPFLQVKGRGVYDYAPITAESYTASTYADRTLAIDLPYQDDGNIAQGVADFLKLLWAITTRKAKRVRINPQESNTLMLAALQREIGDQITLSETMTGLSSVDCSIVGVEFEVAQPAWLTCRWVLAPTFAQNFFKVGTSSVGGSDVLGLV